jgi:hypothetical protein
MAKRAISAGHRAWLIGEIQVWRNEGVVVEDQPERILSLYESAEEISRQKRSLATFALMSVALGGPAWTAHSIRARVRVWS